jgi:hypothetical protein
MVVGLAVECIHVVIGDREKKTTVEGDVLRGSEVKTWLMD